mgnify:CR=1 FL=1
MKHYIAIILFFIIGLGNLLAQTPTLLSLDYAQELASEHSYALKLARLSEAESQSTTKQTLAAGLPHISATAEYNNFTEIPTQVAPADAFGFPNYLNEYLLNLGEATGVSLNAPPVDPNAISELQFGSPHSATVGFTATQLIFSGTYLVAIQAAKVFEDLNKNAIELTAIDVVKSVGMAYHTALASKDNENLLKNALSILEATLVETKALSDAGFIESLDVDMLRLSVSTLKNEIENASLQSQLTTSLLLFQIGLPVDTDVILSDSFEGLVEKIQMINQDASAQIDVNNHPQVMESLYMLEMAELNVKAKTASSLPLISGFYSNSENAQRDEFNIFDSSEKWYPTQLWGLKVSMPVFGSFEGKHIRQKAQVQALKAETGLQMTLQATQLEQSAASAELRRSRDMVDEAINSLSLATKIFDNVKLGHSEGVKSSFELNQVHNQLLTNAGALVGARLRLLNAHSRFIAATTTNK